MASRDNRTEPTDSVRALRQAVAESKAPAISRASAVLRLLSNAETPLNLQAIATSLDLVPSTCLHVLRALVAEHFVAFNPATKQYSLDAGVLTLAQHWLRRNGFVDLVQPIIDKISREFNVKAVGLRIASIEQSIVVAVSQSDPTLQLTTHVGSFFPSFDGATGRCLAAFGDWDVGELHHKFEKLRWDSPPTWKEWLSQVEQTRIQGFAVDRGNYISGVTVVLAPVWETPKTLSHAIIAFGIGDAIKRDRFKALQEILLSESKFLTSQLSAQTSR
ncbi:MAG TPA: IclR family transcriptional regulator C-terminal domain-containing protein [Terriglobales bacterium]|nr:IclR family transcriptional regulator C-terminal domain-containing protein [Terriglobales bacterium]